MQTTEEEEEKEGRPSLASRLVIDEAQRPRTKGLNRYTVTVEASLIYCTRNDPVALPLALHVRKPIRLDGRRITHLYFPVALSVYDQMAIAHLRTLGDTHRLEFDENDLLLKIDDYAFVCDTPVSSPPRSSLSPLGVEATLSLKLAFNDGRSLQCIIGVNDQNNALIRASLQSMNHGSPSDRMLVYMIDSLK